MHQPQRVPERPLRADAQRNRDKILSAAIHVFADEGPNANLNQVAKRAGVGAATLYRNFPTRESLIEAAYRNELQRLGDSASQLLESLAPDQALRTWMSRFIDYATAKFGMADALRAVVESGGTPYSETREMMLASISALLDAGSAAGQLRSDVSAADMLTSLAGIALATRAPGQRDVAERLMDLAMDALRARA
jgi:AcrR family transcriptional regulator